MSTWLNSDSNDSKKNLVRIHLAEGMAVDERRRELAIKQELDVKISKIHISTFLKPFEGAKSRLLHACF